MIRKLISKPQLFYLAILAFSFSLCSRFQLSSLSSMFKFLGASSDSLPLLWLAPPLTGLIVQPLIGQISDDTITRFGKRRPYIIAWSIIAAISFALLPFATSLAYALIFTWIIDCALNGGDEGLRALTGDITTSEEERSKAFAIQAFFAGIGGSIGTSLPFVVHKINGYFSTHSHIVAGTIPHNMRVSFTVTAIVLIIAIAFSTLRLKEKNYKISLMEKKQRKKPLQQRLLKPFREILYSIKRMPIRFRNICFIHSITWMGIFIFWLYFTMAIAQNIYGLPLDANPASNAHFASLLEKATLDSSLYLTIYQYVSIAYALLLYFLSNIKRIKLLHAASLVIGGIGMACLNYEHSTFAILLSICAIGIMWGSILVLPYAIAMQILPKGKLGIYLGIFNISITAPQIFCGLTLSPIYARVFGHHAGYVLLLAGVLIVLSAILWVKEEYRFYPKKIAEAFVPVESAG